MTRQIKYCIQKSVFWYTINSDKTSNIYCTLYTKQIQCKYGRSRTRSSKWTKFLKTGFRIWNSDKLEPCFLSLPVRFIHNLWRESIFARATASTRVTDPVEFGLFFEGRIRVFFDSRIQIRVRIFLYPRNRTQNPGLKNITITAYKCTASCL